MAGMSNYLENRIIDWLVRGQTFTPPATVYVGLLTAPSSDGSPGSEVTGGSYARVPVASSLANWAGTQSAGSTTASSGTSGTTSNNGTLTWPTPSANWGQATDFGIFDAATAGNLLFYGPLGAAKNINNGDPAPTAAPGAMTIQIDN